MKWLVEVTETAGGRILGRYSMEAPDCRHAIERVRSYRKEPRSSDLKVSLSDHGYVERDFELGLTFAACFFTPKSVPPEVDMPAPATSPSPGGPRVSHERALDPEVTRERARARVSAPVADVAQPPERRAQGTRAPKSWNPTQLSMDRIREPEFTVIHEDHADVAGSGDGWFRGAYLVAAGLEPRALEVLLFARFRAGLASLDRAGQDVMHQRSVDIEVYDTDTSGPAHTPIARLFWDETTATPTIELPGYTSPHAVSFRTRRLLGLPDAPADAVSHGHASESLTASKGQADGNSPTPGPVRH